MNEETGEIRPMMDIPEDGRKWIPFMENEEVTIKGIVFKIVRVKQLRQELHLKFVRKETVVKSNEVIKQ